MHSTPAVTSQHRLAKDLESLKENGSHWNQVSSVFNFLCRVWCKEVLVLHSNGMCVFSGVWLKTHIKSIKSSVPREWRLCWSLQEEMHFAELALHGNLSLYCWLGAECYWNQQTHEIEVLIESNTHETKSHLVWCSGLSSYTAKLLSSWAVFALLPQPQS